MQPFPTEGRVIVRSPEEIRSIAGKGHILSAGVTAGDPRKATSQSQRIKINPAYNHLKLILGLLIYDNHITPIAQFHLIVLKIIKASVRQVNFPAAL